MLRVRPVIATNAFNAHASLLTALGMNCVETRPGWQLFDCGNGKVALQQLRNEDAAGGGTRLGFELRDAALFVRRTLADGTHAELAGAPGLPAPGLYHSAKITAPDGFSFWTHPSTDLSLPQSAGPRLTVVQTWCTPRLAEANTVLANIGAKLVRRLPGGGALFRAKNGGLAATAQGGESGVVLGFVYDGALAGLAARLTAAGISAAREGDYLRIKMPGSGIITVEAGKE